MLLQCQLKDGFILRIVLDGIELRIVDEEQCRRLGQHIGLRFQVPLQSAPSGRHIRKGRVNLIQHQQAYWSVSDLPEISGRSHHLPETGMRCAEGGSK